MKIRKDVRKDDIVFSVESSIPIQERKLIKLIKKKYHVKNANYSEFVTWFDEVSKQHIAEIKVSYEKAYT